MAVLKVFAKNLHCFLLLFIFQNLQFTSFVLAEGPPRKIDVSNDKRIIFAHVKQQLELKCPIDSTDTTIYFDWYKGNISFSLYNEQGYTITKKGILKIKSITKDHAGTYTCEGINGYGFARINMTVIVDDPEVENENKTLPNHNSANRVFGVQPTIKKRPSTSVVDDVGGQAIFHCVASGVPAPHIFWFKDGQLILDTALEISNGRAHSTLRLRGLKKSDAGTYKCIARNKVGEDEIDYTLHVSDPSYPPTIVSLEPSTVTVKEGATAVFWCEVKSKSGLKLHIKWLKRLNKKEVGDPMNLDDVTLFRSGTAYYRPLNLSDGVGTNGIHKSKLIIQNAYKEDSGIYVCLALNDKGYNVKNVTLTVLSTVKPLSWPSYFTSKSTTFVATVIIAIVLVLAAIMIITHLYCKGKSQKRASADKPSMKTECESLTPHMIPIQKHAAKDISYPENKDFQSRVTLLCGDKTYNCEHTEHEFSKSVHVKSYLP